MESLKKRAKTVKTTGCIVTLFSIAAGICFAVLMVLSMNDLFASINNTIDQTITSDSSSADPAVTAGAINDMTKVLYKYMWLSIIMLVTFSIAGIGSLIANIMVLSTDWKNPSLNESRMLWGLLGIFLLGGISGWVFGNKAMKVYASTPSTSETTQTTQTTQAAQTNPEDSNW